MLNHVKKNEIIKKIIPSLENLPRDEKYVIAVSGGGDSMFCLDSMKTSGFKNIVVAHVNYQKRENSLWDENKVKKYCEVNSINLEIYRVNKKKYTSIKENFQNWARNLRYNFFKKIAKKYNTKFIVTAHHLDDHLETFFLQKERKNLVEYWGISPKIRFREKMVIARPLLGITKSHINRYLAKKKIDFANDETNEQHLYRRNVVRSMLKDLNKKQKQELILKIKDENKKLSLLKKELKKKTKKFLTNSKIDISKINGNEQKRIVFDKEIWMRLLFFWVNKFTKKQFKNTKKQIINEIYRQIISSRKKNFNIHIGKGWIIKKTNQELILSKKISF